MLEIGSGGINKNEHVKIGELKMSIEFEEGGLDSIEDLEAARKAIQGELVKFNVTPLFIHYPLIIRALHELIIIRKHLEKKHEGA
jgi:hypothetical protein